MLMTIFPISLEQSHEQHTLLAREGWNECINYADDMAIAIGERDLHSKAK